MMNKLITFFVAIFMLSTMNSQVKVGSVYLPTELLYNDQNLILNGSGVREKWFFKIYSIGLYLPEKSKNARDIINMNNSMGVRFTVTSNLLDREKFASAFYEGFNSSTNGKIGPLRSRIEEFFNYMPDEIKVGNVYDVIYHKGEGTTIYFEGEKRGTVKGFDFKRALYGIWLGEDPAKRKLKKELLGLK